MLSKLSYAGVKIGNGDQATMARSRLVNDELVMDETEKTKMGLLTFLSETLANAN